MKVPKYIQYPFPEDFLSPVTKTGPWGEYYIDERRQAVHLCYLELLQELDRICRKYNLKYWAEGGTLLGAIRHKGFIPWDDDVDTCMFRKDYEKLLEIWREGKEVKFPYFVAENRGCVGTSHQFARLCLEGTTRITWDFELNPKWKMRPSLGIDIFPVDYISNSGDDSEFYDSMRGYRHDMQRVIHGDETLTVEEQLNYNKVFEKILRKYENLENPKYVETLCMSQARYRHEGDKLLWVTSTRRETRWLAELINWPFEYISIPVPIGYKECLDRQYPGWDEAFIQFHSHKGHDSSSPWEGYEEPRPELMSEERQKEKEAFIRKRKLSNTKLV